MCATKNEAKDALDKLIRISRVHLYKPIQIAEILYKNRVDESLNLLSLEQYRNRSKKWRDDISIELLGRVCTSSARFQDNLFDSNAIPPEILSVLGDENRRTNGGVEAYIYGRFLNKHLQLNQALDLCRNARKEDFLIEDLINSFWYSPGLRRSLDKIYEIIVYALFSTLVENLNLQVEVSVSESAFPLVKEFEDFSRKVMCLDFTSPQHIQSAKVYRVGVTNAADRGLDMYSNWGPAIQIKHLTLSLKLAENIVNGVSSDRIVIVCKDAEKEVIISLLSQIGWQGRVQSVVTELDLIDWYEKALRGTFSGLLGDRLLECLVEEIMEEFPAVDSIPVVLQNRHYENLVTDPFWGRGEE